MTRLVTLSNVPHPSLYEHLLCVLFLPRHLDSLHGGTLYSATFVCSTVSPPHRHVVYMDGLQDHFLSHSESISVQPFLDMCSMERRQSLPAQQHPYSHSLVCFTAVCGCGFTNSCATYPTKRGAARKTNSTVRGALFPLGESLNRKPSPCAGLPFYSACFSPRSTTRISFSQRRASWPPHSHMMNSALQVTLLEKLSVPLQDTSPLK